MSRPAQPDAVVKIVQRGGSLPPEHPAVAILAQLTEANDRARVSHAAWLRALTAVADAGAAAEVAKLAVVQVYRDNVVDITRAVGEELADRCFPRIRSSRRKGGGEEGGE